MYPDEATARLHAVKCPGCGCEPEVQSYYVTRGTTSRRGYACTCGTVVVDGIVMAQGIRD